MHLTCKSETERCPSDERRLLLKISLVWRGLLGAVECLNWLERESPWSGILSPDTDESAAMLAILLRVEARDKTMHVNRATGQVLSLARERRNKSARTG